MGLCAVLFYLLVLLQWDICSVKNKTMSKSQFEEIFDIWKHVENKILQRPATNRNMGVLKIWRSLSLPVYCNFEHLGDLGMHLNPSNNPQEFEQNFVNFTKNALNMYASFVLDDFKTIADFSWNFHGGDTDVFPLKEKAIEIFGVNPKNNENEELINKAYWYLISLAIGRDWMNVFQFSDFFEETDMPPEQQMEKNCSEWKTTNETNDLPWDIWDYLSTTYHIPVVLMSVEANSDQVRQTSEKVISVCEKMNNLFPQNPSLVSAQNCSLNFVNNNKIHGQYSPYDHQISLCVSSAEIPQTYVHEWMHAIDFASRGLVKKLTDSRNTEIKPIIDELLHTIQYLERDDEQTTVWCNGFYQQNIQNWIEVLHQWVEKYEFCDGGTIDLSAIEKNFIKALLTFGDDSDKRRAVERVINPILKVPVPRNDISHLISDVLNTKDFEKFLRKQLKEKQSFFAVGSKLNDYRRKQKFFNNANYTSVPAKEVYYARSEEMLARAAEVLLSKITDLGYDSDKEFQTISFYPKGNEATQLRPVFEQLIATLNKVFAPETSLASKIQEKRQVKQLEKGSPKP